MSSQIGYGSQVTSPIVIDGPTTIATSGQYVVDKIFINNGSGLGTTTIDIQSGAGVSVHSWTAVDLSSGDSSRNGISCGIYGLRVTGGLRIVVSDTVTGVNISVAYRKVLD